MSESPTAPPKIPKIQWLPGFLGVMLVALIARVWIVGDGFWLDEIWCWSRLENIDSLLDVLTKKELKHDNNHPLISMWMHVVGDTDSWVLYRIPSLVAGLVSVVLVMDFTKGTRGVVIPGAVFALSFSMILYSTEARGYAMAICCALGAYRILVRSEAREFRLGPVEAVGYWLLCIFGFLGHLIGVHFFAGMLAWTGIRLLRKVSFGQGVVRMLWIHGVPMAFFAWLFLEFVRQLVVGGGSNVPLEVTVQDVLAWTSGMPSDLLFAVPGALGMVGLAVWEVYSRSREGSYEWIVLPSVALVAPLASLLAATEGGLLNARFFLIGIAFVLLYAGRALARLHARAGGTATFAVIVFLVFALGNVVREVRYVSGGGRGQYLAAVEHVTQNSPQVFWIGSDMDFRSGNLLRYYLRFVPEGQMMRYRQNAPNAPAGPDWFFVHTVLYPEWGTVLPQPDIRLAGGAYRFDRSFTHWGPSGFSWLLYRRVR